MCLYPRLIKNRKYTKNKKNNGVIPEIKDYRTQYVPIGCGNCIECRKQKSNEWRVRMLEEIKEHKYNYFITLSFSPEALRILCEELAIKEANAVAIVAMRRFLERWRKEHKKSIKHWFITELGHINSERIHLHGVLFLDKPITNEYLEKKWSYGNTYIGDYCNEKTISYIVKYITKIDLDHKGYKAVILASPGIGSNYFKRDDIKAKHKFRGAQTIETYTLNNGAEINLPIYYRNNLFTEEQREKLWINKLKADRRYVRGIEIKNASHEGYSKLMRVLKEQQEENKNMGYGSTDDEWKQKEYNITLKMLKSKKIE